MQTLIAETVLKIATDFREHETSENRQFILFLSSTSAIHLLFLQFIHFEAERSLQILRSQNFVYDLSAVHSKYMIIIIIIIIIIINTEDTYIKWY